MRSHMPSIAAQSSPCSSVVRVRRVVSLVLAHATIAAGFITLALVAAPEHLGTAAGAWILKPFNAALVMAILALARLLLKAWHNRPGIMVPRMTVELALSCAALVSMTAGLAAHSLGTHLPASGLVLVLLLSYSAAMLLTLWCFDRAMSKQDAEQWTFTLATWLTTFVLVTLAVLALVDYTAAHAT